MKSSKVSIQPVYTDIFSKAGSEMKSYGMMSGRENRPVKRWWVSKAESSRSIETEEYAVVEEEKTKQDYCKFQMTGNSFV